jgi:restriction endonuclease S subunit
MALVELGSVLVEQRTAIGSPDGDNLPLIGVSNQEGLIRSKQERLADVSRYKILKKGWFAYNPMRINVGSIGVADTDEKTGIISPDYVVFSCGDKILPEYFYFFIRSEIGLTEIAKNTGGSVRERLYFKNLAKIKIKLPSIEEQKLILTRLKSIDDLSKNIQLALREADDLLKVFLRKTFSPEDHEPRIVI